MDNITYLLKCLQFIDMCREVAREDENLRKAMEDQGILEAPEGWRS